MTKTIPSKYKGHCLCGSSFVPGTAIEWFQGRVQSCPECRDASDEDGDETTIGQFTQNISASELRVEVRRIMWSAPDHSHVIALVTLDPECLVEDIPVSKDDKFSIIGPLGQLSIGDVVCVNGRWEPNTKFGGMQFRCVGPASLAVSETAAGMKRFLVRFIPHCGPKTAEKIITECGGPGSVFNMIRDTPLELCNVAGITEERALDMQSKLVDSGGFAELQLFAAEIGMSNYVLAQCIDLWGLDSKAMILEDPYILMSLERVGFVAADKIAIALKMTAHDPRRCAAATLYLLEQSTYQDGHTWTTFDHMIKDVADDMKSTGLTIDQLKTGVELLRHESSKKSRTGNVITIPPRVTIVGDRIYLASIEYAERMIAEKLLSMLGDHGTKDVSRSQSDSPVMMTVDDLDSIAALM